MAKRICLLNGENHVQDYDVNQWFSEALTPGILAPAHFAITPQGPEDNTVNVAPGICIIEVTRTADQKTFKIFAESNDVEIVTVTGTGGNVGAIIVAIPKTNVQDGNPNPEDGTGVFDIIYVEGVGVSPLTDGQINSQTSNLYFWVRLADITQDATVSSGDIDFVGALPNLNNLKNLDAQSITTDQITEKTMDEGVTIDTWLLKDGVLVAEEIGTPATPATDKWGFYFKSDGAYIIDDAGIEYKIASGALVPTITAILGETVTSGTPLRMWLDGKAYKTSASKDIEYDTYGSAAINITFPSLSIFNNNKLGIHKIATDKWLFAYSYYDQATTTHYIEAKVGTVTNGRWTFGGTVTFDAEADNAEFVFDPVCGVAVVTSGIIYLAWIVNDNPENDEVVTRRATISGTTITLGTRVQVETGSTNYNRVAISPVQTSGTDYIIAIYQGSNTSNALRAKCVQNTSVGASVTVESSATSFFDLSYNKEQQVIAIYEDSVTDDINARVITQTINTTTLTLETENASIIAGSLNSIQIERSALDKHLFIYFNEDDFTLNSCSLTISGVTPSVGTPEIILQGANSANAMTAKKTAYKGRLQNFANNVWGVIFDVIAEPNAKDFFAGGSYDSNNVHQQGGQRFIQFAFIDFSGSNPIPFVQNPIIWGYVDGACLWYEEGKEKSPYLVTCDVVQRKAASRTTNQYRIDINNFIGWADEGGNANDLIIVNPIKDDNQLSLQPGRVYSLGPNGTMEIHGTGKSVAQAINTTTLMRIYDSSNYF
jgi:hypothetical protein